MQREIAQGQGAGLSRNATTAMEATPAGREALRRIKAGVGIPAGMEIVSQRGGKGFEIRKARTRARKINTALEKKRLVLLAEDCKG